MTPYEREMRLMPYIEDMSRRGVTVDLVGLEQDIKFYQDKFQYMDERIQEILGQRVDVDKKKDLLECILFVDLADTSKLHLTAKTGSYSASQASLFDAVTHPELLGLLMVRAATATCLRTFMMPWYNAAKFQEGKIYIKWNQFRNYTDTGARTGRMSSSPNLQNVPTDWGKLKARLGQLEWELPWDMPEIRKYIIPAEGNVFISRDYSAQEMRLLAHFAGGALLEELQANPTEDVHMIAAQVANVSRTVAKTLGFAVLYGAGGGRIAETLGCTVAEAYAIRREYYRALPEIKQFQQRLTSLAKAGLPVDTIAGRLYFCEDPKIIDGCVKTFEYKLSNYKIQGSAADQTKQAMYHYATHCRSGELRLQVHDQLVIEVPEEDKDSAKAILEEAMNSSFQEELKYKVISDEAVGYTFGGLK